MDQGIFLGSDLNESNDYLGFTLLFKHLSVLDIDASDFSNLTRLLIDSLTSNRHYSEQEKDTLKDLCTHDRPIHSADWLKQRFTHLINEHRVAAPQQSWGWKEPNTHMVLERLTKLIPGMKYIHVVRHGLDMAFSDNQNQLRLWGRNVLGDAYSEDAKGSLAYWCATHRHIKQVGQPMGNHFLWLDYDRFCLHPEEGIDLLSSFAGLQTDQRNLTNLATVVKPPLSIGRYRQFSLDQFDPDDIDCVREMGFDI